MTPFLNETHDLFLKSWVESANAPDCDFPIQNLPFGVFQRRESEEPARIGIAIGDRILDLTCCIKLRLFDHLPESLKNACTATRLNSLMALGSESASLLRSTVSQLLRIDSGQSPPEANILVAMTDAELLLPAEIGDYTDFYASIFHATNVGKLFRPDNPLLPNYKYVPIAYHGRASSIVPGGIPICRPQGQRKPPDAAVPEFALSRMLDYELEVGCFVGAGNSIGQPISIDRAEDHIFGLCLVNDWSARDLQAWEYQPLGPFLAKNFATTLSPWIVTLEALAPFRDAAFQRSNDDPQPLPYLFSKSNQESGGFAITLEVWLRTEQMRAEGMAAVRLSQGSFSQMYWTIAQMLTHHASNGCNLRSGDLLASGTVSNANPGSQGCLLELTQRGTQPISLPTGETRTFLADGDEITLRGFCERAGYARIGFGECRAVVQPSG